MNLSATRNPREPAMSDRRTEHRLPQPHSYTISFTRTSATGYHLLASCLLLATYPLACHPYESGPPQHGTSVRALSVVPSLPYTDGTAMSIWQGFGTASSTDSHDQGPHIKHAIDFNIRGNGDLGNHVLAVADGEIVLQYDGCSHGGTTDTAADCGGPVGKWGNTIIIKHRDGIYSQYNHLAFGSIPETLKGSSTEPVRVCRGQYIGDIGSTGFSTGPHLHFQMQEGRLGSNTIRWDRFVETDAIPPERALVYSRNFEITTCNPPAWWCTAIDVLFAQGILTRTCAQFSRGERLRRAEWAVMLSRSLRLNTLAGFGTCSSPYSDVTAGKWYTPHVAMLARLDHGDGTTVFDASKSTFEPKKFIRRCDAVVSLVEAFDIQAPPGTLPPMFADLGSVPSWCMGALTTAAAAGLVNQSGGNFRPRDEITMGEAASMLANVIGEPADLLSHQPVPTDFPHFTCRTCPPSSDPTVDSDLDGSPDINDRFPCDPTATSELYLPAAGVHGMIMMEDQWPAQPDLDVNDFVTSWNYEFQQNAVGRTRRAIFTYNIHALGGMFDNGLGLQLPVARTEVAAASLRIGRGPPLVLVPESADTQFTVVIHRDLRALFGGASGQINSLPTLPVQPNALLEISIEFAGAVPLNTSGAPFDLFLFRTNNRAHEIHLPLYPGTAQMDPNLFGGPYDGSGNGTYFVDPQGIPAALSVPEFTPYPAEGASVDTLMPNIVGFAQSGGTMNRDYYNSLIVPAAQYFDVNGAGPSAPSVLPSSPQADGDQDGVVATLDCDDTESNTYPGAPELCDGRDNNCDGQIDEGTGPMHGYQLDGDGDGIGVAPVVQACAAPPNHVAVASCVQGSNVDCNPSGSTQRLASRYVDPSPPRGWRQCAGFINTVANDVGAGFLRNCLGASGLRVLVTNQMTGQVEEDVEVTGLAPSNSWPSFGYLGAAVTSHASTNWGSTPFFITTDGRDACGHLVTQVGLTTFGSGQGNRAMIVGGAAGADEYRLNCNGGDLVDRSIAVYVEDSSVAGMLADCDDADSQAFPGNTEICDGKDNDCDALTDEGVQTTFFRDRDRDGVGTDLDTVTTCHAPSGYIVSSGLCLNGQTTNCNTPGSTLVSTSAFVDPSPPSGWRQCAGFVNTTADDVGPTILNGCLGVTSLRVIVTNLTTGQVEEDVQETGMSTIDAWPAWNYLGGSVSASVRTNWGQTGFFVADGRDACGNLVGSTGEPTLGTGNGSRAIIVGGDSGASEYGINCGGPGLTNRSIALYTLAAAPLSDCDDGDPAINPGAPELCNGIDDNCNSIIDEENPGGGAGCATGVGGSCDAGTTHCTSGILMCVARNRVAAEICSDQVDNDCNGRVDEPSCVLSLCNNGSAAGDCNPAGATLQPTSIYYDPAPPMGWEQCAGFINTSIDDVAGNFMDNCLGSSRLRLIVTNLATGQVEEDVSASELGQPTTWPNGDYLNGSVLATQRTNWGTTPFFTTTNGRDSCGLSIGPAGQPTLGAGNARTAIVVPGDPGSGEYRIDCGGQVLINRSLAIYR